MLSSLLGGFMRKQIVLSSLFLIPSLLLNLVQATNLDDLEECPIPSMHQNEDGPINLLPGKENPNSKVGYKCKALSVETKNYVPGGAYFQWTLVKKGGGNQIWAVDIANEMGGRIYVGSVENSYYSFDKAKEACDRKEVIDLGNGETYSITMTLPAIGFGKTDKNHPLNFELLRFLNYESVVSNEDRNWFWSRSPFISSSSIYVYVGTFSSDDSEIFYYEEDRNNVYGSARCVGH